jgi:O-acetyl-ADP-ribose deacetylase (regulator of RNase III)
MQKIKLVRGDITQLRVNAIVNAANSTLLGGGGVDGAIHRAAGAELLEACKKLNGCETGNAKITKGYQLPAKFVIHTVGPIYNNGKNGEAEKLAACYRNSLHLATTYKLNTIAFPNISTGIYGYPKKQAAIIAINEVSKYLQLHLVPTQVLFCVFDQENHDIYKQLLSEANISLH